MVVHTATTTAVRVVFWIALMRELKMGFVDTFLTYCDADILSLNNGEYIFIFCLVVRRFYENFAFIVSQGKRRRRVLEAEGGQVLEKERGGC